MKSTSKTRWTLAHQNMIASVINFCLATANVATTQLLPVFYNLINGILKANLATIETLRALIAQPITGYASQKKALKDALVAMSAAYMKSVYAYAISNNNQVLAGQMKVSASDLNKMSYSQLVAFVKSAINITTPLVPQLTADYMVTAAGVTAWQALLTQLSNVLTNPKNAISNRSSINKQIQNLLRDCMTTLYDQCDQLAFFFKNDPSTLDYYNTYNSNRRLDDHHLHTQLRAHITDELGQPIENADIIIDGDAITESTDNKGYALLSGITFGSHTVTVITGENSKTFGPFDFKKGQSLTQHFIVAPVFAPFAKSKATKAKVAAK